MKQVFKTVTKTFQPLNYKKVLESYPKIPPYFEMGLLLKNQIQSFYQEALEQQNLQDQHTSLTKSLLETKNTQQQNSLFIHGVNIKKIQSEEKEVQNQQIQFSDNQQSLIASEEKQVQNQSDQSANLTIQEDSTQLSQILSQGQYEDLKIIELEDQQFQGQEIEIDYQNTKTEPTQSQSQNHTDQQQFNQISKIIPVKENLIMQKKIKIKKLNIKLVHQILIKQRIIKNNSQYFIKSPRSQNSFFNQSILLIDQILSQSTLLKQKRIVNLPRNYKYKKKKNNSKLISIKQNPKNHINTIIMNNIQIGIQKEQIQNELIRSQDLEFNQFKNYFRSLKQSQIYNINNFFMNIFNEILNNLPNNWNKQNLKLKFSEILYNTILNNMKKENISYEVLWVAKELYKMKKMEQKEILECMLIEAKLYTDESEEQIKTGLESQALNFTIPLQLLLNN